MRATFSRVEHFPQRWYLSVTLSMRRVCRDPYELFEANPDHRSGIRRSFENETKIIFFLEGIKIKLQYSEGPKSER